MLVTSKVYIMAFLSMNPALLQAVDFLLPTGIFVQMNCVCGHQVGDIKEALWKEAEKFPLFDKLKEIERYTLVFINRKAEQEECMDESYRMCDLQMYTPLFKVLERKSDNGEKVLTNQLTLLIGKGPKDFDIRDPEVNDFRFTMVEKSKKAIEERNKADWEAKLMYFAPPDLENDVDPSNTLAKDALGPRGTFFIQVHASTPEQRDQKYKLSVSPTDNPANVIASAQKRVIRATGEKAPDEYVLKVRLAYVCMWTGCDVVKVLGSDGGCLGHREIKQFCVHVCVCVCVHVCVHVCVYVCVHVCVHVCFVCMCMCFFVCFVLAVVLTVVVHVYSCVYTTLSINLVTGLWGL